MTTTKQPDLLTVLNSVSDSVKHKTIGYAVEWAKKNGYAVKLRHLYKGYSPFVCMQKGRYILQFGSYRDDMKIDRLEQSWAFDTVKAAKTWFKNLKIQ